MENEKQQLEQKNQQLEHENQRLKTNCTELQTVSVLEVVYGCGCRVMQAFGLRSIPVGCRNAVVVYVFIGNCRKGGQNKNPNWAHREFGEGAQQHMLVVRV